MAEAAALSTKGMGVDYASNAERFVLGASVGSAASSGLRIGEGQSQLPQGGFAFQVSAMAGMNLGAFADEDSPARRFLIYANGMQMERHETQFDSELMNAGAHLQVKLLRPRIEDNKGWGGLDLTTGYEFSQYSRRLTQGVSIERGKNGWDATGDYAIDSTTEALPLELSTNVRMGALSLYAGGGYDLWRRGHSASDIALDGTLTTKVEGEEAMLGSASLLHAQQVSLGDAVPRGFFGLQMNVFVVGAYAQVNLQPGTAFGGHAGMRVAL